MEDWWKKKLKIVWKLFFFILFLFFLISITYAGPSLIESNQWQWNLTGVWVGSTAFGDVDNDGDLDLILTGPDAVPVDHAKIYINNGTSFEESNQWQWNLTGLIQTSLSLGDVDNDGNLDFALMGRTSLGVSYAKIYINNGTSFEESNQWQWNFTPFHDLSLIFGDVNNDGKIDLLLGGYPFTVYLNNGSSLVANNIWGENVVTSLSSGISQGLAEALDLGDYDNDGDLDLLMGGHDGGDPRNKLFKNNGTTFVLDVDELTPGINDCDLAFGDVDNDGDLDIVELGAFFAQSFASLFINVDGQLISNSSWKGDLASTRYGALAFGDHDNDGDLDLAWTGGVLSNIYENSGSRFNLDGNSSDNLTDVQYSSVAWGDVDDDGDLDLIITGPGNDVDTPYTKLYISNKSLTQPNVPPLAPTNFSNLSTNATNGKMIFTWANASDNATATAGLYYNLRIGTTSNGHEIVSGVYGGGSRSGNGGGANGYFGNMMQRKNATLNIPDRDYYWAIQAIDTTLKAGNWSAEQVYNTSPSITINSPGDYINISNFTIIFNVSSSDNVNLSNVTLYGNWSGSFAVNETNSTEITSSDFNFNVTLNEGIQTFAIRVCDTSHNCLITNNNTLTIDSKSPDISAVSPLDGSTIESATVIATATYSDFTTTTCQARIDAGTWQEMIADNTRAGTANYTFTLVTDAEHTIETNCTDILSNSTINTTTFTVNSGITDTTAPAITLSSPVNSSNFSVSTVAVTANYTDQNIVSCITRINSGNWFEMDGDGGTSGIVNYTFNSLSDSQNGIINVNCTDSESNSNIVNITVIIDTTNPSIQLDSPSSAKVLPSTSVTFNFTAIDENLESCSLYGNWTTGWHLNQTISALNNTGTNFTTLTLEEGSFIWNVYCNDTLANNAYNEANLTFRMDTIRPSIALVSPADDSTQTSSSTVTFTYNVSDIAIQNCSLFIGGSLDQTSTSITVDTSQTFSKSSLSNADYNWNINCTDSANNANTSQTFTLTLNVASDGSPGGGGGGGGGVLSKFDVDFSVSTTKSVSALKGSSLSLSFDGTTKHTIKINEVASNSATITISSDPVTLTLNLGETKKVDINQDGIDDISIKLNNVVGNTVHLVITKLAGALIIAKEGVKKKTFSNKNEIRAIVTQGETVKESIIITNIESKALDFKLELLELTEHVLLSDWEFSLDPGKSKVVDLHFVAASDEELGKKTGKIRIKAGSKEEDIILVMEVKKREGLFDVKVRISEKFKEIFLGDDVTSEITLTNLGKIGKVDVVLDYSIRDLQDNIIKSATDTLAVETVTSFIRTLKVPKTLAEGNYTFFVDVTYQDTIAHGKDNFFVKGKKPGFIQRRFKEIIIGVVVLFSIIVAGYFGMREKKLEKEEKELKKKEATDIRKLRKEMKELKKGKK